MPARLCLTALGLLFLMGLVDCDDACVSVYGAQAPGDVLIGVLSSCYAMVEELDERDKPNSFNCTDFNLISFVKMLAIIHTIDSINDSGFLPGVQLGYMVSETCSNPTKALQSVEYMISLNSTLKVGCELADRPLVKALIGARFSEVSIAVARLLGLYMVPQISTSSSAAILSDKLRFPSFLRTVPSDVYQTQALAKTMSFFGWDWVGVVYGDDDYGIAAIQSFLQNANTENICVAFKEVMPHYLNNGDTDKTVVKVADIIRSSTAKVVLLILKEELVMKLFNEMIGTNTSRIWIATDAWSMSRTLATMPGINSVGKIFGFSFITEPNLEFNQYLQNLQMRPGAVNHLIEEYKNLRFGCTPDIQQYMQCMAKKPEALCSAPPSLSFKSPQACNLTDPQKANDDFLVKNVDMTFMYSERLAVWAIAYALQSLLSCNKTLCSGERDFPPWMLLQEIKKVNFTLNNRQFYFDQYGNSINGYDFINWIRDRDFRNFNVVGQYNLQQGRVEINMDEIDWGTPNNKVLESKCSPSCPVGQFKKVSNISCCFDCRLCEEGTYSNVSNLQDCYPCPSDTWSLKGWDHCEYRRETFFSWGDHYAIALLTLEGLGVLLVILVFIVFLVGRHSPAVKVAGGYLCFIMMAGLAISFGGMVLFMLRPLVLICQARQIMYGMGFTLCVSCILVKAFRTFLAFLFDLNKQYNLKKLYKPIAIITITTGTQGLICIFWLVFDTPKVDFITSNQSMEIVLQCNEGYGVGFGIMLSYIALLAFVCFLLAFKGRRVPHRFNETGYIIFSMLIYLFVWVCFIPIYVTNNQQRSEVQASAILVSNYGIIFCHFIPKCYMILCKKKTENTTQAYLEKVRIFSIASTNLAFTRSSVKFRTAAMESPVTPRSTDSAIFTNSSSSVATGQNGTLAPENSSLRRRLRSSSV